MDLNINFNRNAKGLNEGISLSIPELQKAHQCLEKEGFRLDDVMISSGDFFMMNYSHASKREGAIISYSAGNPGDRFVSIYEVDMQDGPAKYIAPLDNYIKGAGNAPSAGSPNP